MSPAVAILERAKAAGVSLSVADGRILAAPRGAMTDELRGLIRAHKSELVEALKGPAPRLAAGITSASGARHETVRTMLEYAPGRRYAVVTDVEADPTAVILTLALRSTLPGGDVVTCDLRIPREKYDGFLLLHLIEKHCGAAH